MRRLRALLAVLAAVTVAGAESAAGKEFKVSPSTMRYDVPDHRVWISLSDPAYLAEDAEETPYQLLQICRASDQCRTLLDLRGIGGMSISSDPSLAFSPDRLYFMVQRMTGVEPASKTFRTQYFEVWGVREFAPVVFRTAEQKEATGDNILGWAEQYPHALKISIGRKKFALALPSNP